MTGRVRNEADGAPGRARAPLAALLLLAVVSLLGLAGAACGDERSAPDQDATPAPDAAVALLEAAAAKMSPDGFTAHLAFGSQLTFDAPDGSSSYTATGSGDLEMPTALRYVVDVMAGEGGGSIEVVTVDGETYYTRDANDSEQPWSASDSPLAVPFDLGAEIGRYLAMATATEVVKVTEEQGQRLFLIRVTMDPLEYADGRSEIDMRTVFAQTFGLGEQETEAALKSGTAFAEFKVGEDDGYVHDLTERWLVRLDGGQGFLQEVALSFSRFAEPLVPPIEVPESE